MIKKGKNMTLTKDSLDKETAQIILLLDSILLRLIIMAMETVLLAPRELDRTHLGKVLLSKIWI